MYGVVTKPTHGEPRRRRRYRTDQVFCRQQHRGLRDQPRSESAAREILTTEPIISAQVLNETLNVFRRKQKLDWATIDEHLDDLKDRLTVVPLTVDTHTLGATIARVYGLATYDAMIAATALETGCATLWSEDMHDGLLIAGRLTVRNPFLNAAT